MSDEDVQQVEQEPKEEQVADGKPEEVEVKEEEVESEDEEIEYECPAEFDERVEMRKMFVGGIDKETTDEEFKNLFTEFGEVTDHVIIRSDTKKSDRLFGFITFSKCDELEECLLKRPHKYKEKELDVKRAVPKGQEDSYGHYKVKKLHVANIPALMKEKELMRYLKRRHPQKYGQFQEVNFLKSKDDGCSEKNRGFGFITVSSEDFADRVSIGETKFTLNDKNLRIAKAKPRNADGQVTGGRGFRGKGQMNQGGWDNYGWGGYGGYGQDYYGGYGGYNYGGYGPHRGGRGGGNRYQPY